MKYHVWRKVYRHTEPGIPSLTEGAWHEIAYTETAKEAFEFAGPSRKFGIIRCVVSSFEIGLEELDIAWIASWPQMRAEIYLVMADDYRIVRPQYFRKRRKHRRRRAYRWRPCITSKRIRKDETKKYITVCEDWSPKRISKSWKDQSKRRRQWKERDYAGS